MLNNDFGVAIRSITHHFLPLSSDFSIKGDSSPSWSLSRDISFMDTLSSFGRFLQNVVVSCFSNSFVPNQQSDGSCKVSNASCYTIYSRNSPFFSANTDKKYIVSRNFCIGRLNHKKCFLPKFFITVY